MTDANRAPTVSQLIQAGRDREAAQYGVLAVSGDGLPDPGEANGEPMDPLAQLDRLGPAIGEVVANITPDQLERRTPCTDFTVRGILEHMIVGGTLFTGAFRGEEAPAPDLTDPLAGFGPALGGLVAAMRAPGALDQTIQTPFGAMDGEAFARYVVLDGLVHGWDLATATGQAYDPPDDVVAAATEFGHQVLDSMRDGRTFADAVEPAPDATPIERLAAYTGRRPLALTS